MCVCEYESMCECRRTLAKDLGYLEFTQCWAGQNRALSGRGGHFSMESYHPSQYAVLWMALFL